ncbi:MAG: Ig-like domain-containing protein, partial [Myxococcaceae bacterium]|nr:Ig-like domain-containing protein [Myxococcaceae bacterium]
AGGAAGGEAGGTGGGSAGGAAGGGVSGGAAGGTAGGVAGGEAGGTAGGVAGGVAGGAVSGGLAGGVAGGHAGGTGGGAAGGAAGGTAGGGAGGEAGGTAGGAAGGEAGGASGGVAGGASGGTAGGAAGGTAGGFAGGASGGTAGGVAGGTAGATAGGAAGSAAGGTSGGLAGGAAGGGVPSSLAVFIDLPVGGTLTSDPMVSVSGRVLGGVGPWALTINGTPVAVVLGEYSGQVAAPEGDFLVSVSVTDSAGATAQAQRTISVDRTAPTITLVRPASNPATATSALVTIEGTAADLHLAEVRVDGLAVATLAGRFVTDVTLSTGRTSIVVEAADQVGNRSFFTQRFDASGLPPTVTILAPADGANVDEPVVHVRARVNAAMQLSRVDIGTSQAFPNAAGDYEATVPLALGNTTILVRAVDVAGQEGRATVVVRYRDPSTEPLAVTGIDPASGATDIETDRRVTIAFNKAIQPADFSTQFVVKANGVVLPGGYYLVPGDQTLSFAAQAALPEGQRITVEVANVSPQVGPGLSAPFRSSFSVRKPLTELHGVVLDENALPLPGVAVRIDALNLSTRTTEQGNWSLFVPGTGRWEVTFEGGQLADGRLMPSVKRFLLSRDGERTLEATVFLNPVDVAGAATVSSGGGAVRAGSVTLDLPAQAIVFSDGRLAGPVTLTEVPVYLRGPRFSDTLGPVHLWQMTPAGTRLLAPVTVSVPNAENAPPGRLALFYGYSPTEATIARAGFGRVTADGARIETLAPFQPASLEWFGYRMLADEEAAVVEPLLNPVGPTGGAPDGSLGWLHLMPESFDDVVDWVLPRAHADFLGQPYSAHISALDEILNNSLPYVVRGTVRASTSRTRFTASTPPGLVVTRAATGTQNPPSPEALAAISPGPQGGFLIGFKAVALQQGAPTPLSILVTARRGDGTNVLPTVSDKQGQAQVELASTVELAPGVTFLTFRLIEDAQAHVIEHRLDFSLGADGGPGSLAVTEVANSTGDSLDSLVRFPGVAVQFTGSMTAGGRTGPTGQFGLPVLTWGPSVGIACATIPVGFRLDAFSKGPGKQPTFQYVSSTYDFCSPQLGVGSGFMGRADINVDARLFYGHLVFRNRRGEPIPLDCSSPDAPGVAWTGDDAELTSVSALDIASTEVSIFRAEDLTQPIITTVPGRALESDAGTLCAAPFAAYSVLRLGPTSIIRSNQFERCRDIDALGGPTPADAPFYDRNCANDQYNSTLSPGDPLVLVAVNYRTGYAGFVRTRVPTINRFRGVSPFLPDGGLIPGAPLPDGGCTTPGFPLFDNPVGGVTGQVPSCTVQDIGIPTSFSLYPPELELRVARSRRPQGLNSNSGANSSETLVRHGGLATTGDDFISVRTRWGVRSEPRAYRACVEREGQLAGVCEPLALELGSSEQRDAGSYAIRFRDAGALVDIGSRGLPLEVPCADLPSGAPDAAWNVCLSGEYRIIDMPAGVAPLSGQLARWTGSAIEQPVVPTFPIAPGGATTLVEVSQVVQVGGALQQLSSLPTAIYYVHVVGHSQFGELLSGMPVNRTTPPGPVPPPFFTQRLDGGSIPLRAIALKGVYRSFEPVRPGASGEDGGSGSPLVERYDAVREHEFRVIDLDAGAWARTFQPDAGEVVVRSLTAPTPDPQAQPGDLSYEFAAALLGPVTQTRVQRPLGNFRLRIGSDRFGRECDLHFNPGALTLRGQCDADAVEDVLEANDIVYLELFLAGNAENVLWRTNFYGLTRRTDFVASNSAYTRNEAKNKAARTANSRQTTQRPRATFTISQAEVPTGTRATVELCSDGTCSEVLVRTYVRRQAQSWAVVSGPNEVGGTVGLVEAGADGTATFLALLPEDYAELERHDGIQEAKKPVIRIVKDLPGVPWSVVELGSPRGRFESFDSRVWAQPAIGPVSVNTGRLTFEHTDLAVPFAPTMMAFTRSYNNQNNVVGALGVGWRHNFEGQLVEESADRLVLLMGAEATQFVRCTFAGMGSAFDCDNDGSHGATIRRVLQTVNGAPRAAFIVTEASGRRLLFRHQVEPSPAAAGDQQASLPDGGREALQKRWFLTGIDEGPGADPSTWFDADLPANWLQLHYSSGTSRVERVARQGVTGGREFQFAYDPVAQDAPNELKVAARRWGLLPLKSVKLMNVADVAVVTFTQSKETFALEGAVRSTAGADEQEWRYEYQTAAASGIKGIEGSNEVSRAKLLLAPPDGGTRLVQWLGEYGRSSLEAPLPDMPQVSGQEFVATIREPGQQGVSHDLSGGIGRTLKLATGEVVSFGMAAYGAANSTTLGTSSTATVWTSQKDSVAPVKPGPMVDSTAFAQHPGLDARLRSGGTTVTSAYSAADPSLGTATGPRAFVEYTSDRFPAGQTVTQPVQGTRPAVVTTTTVDPAHGGITEEKVVGEGGTFVPFSGAIYDDERRLTQWTDEEGRVVVASDFDPHSGLPRQLVLTKPGASPSTALASLTRKLEYDTYGRVTQTRDVETGAETLVEYDAVGRELRRTTRGTGPGNPDDVVETEYTLADNALTVTQRYPNVSGYQRTTTTVDGLVTATSWRYGANNASTATEENLYDAGRLTRRRDARNSWHSYSYDTQGLLVSESVEAGDGGSILVREVARDTEGRVLRETDVLGAEVKVPRDQQARASGTVATQTTLDGGAPVSKTSLDTSGFVRAAQVGSKTYQVKASALGPPAEIALGSDVTVQQAWDAAGRLVSRTELVSGVTETWEYQDVLGRLTKYQRSYPSGGSTKQVVETRTYQDAASRTSTVTVTREVDGVRTEKEVLVVDTRGRLLSRTEDVTTSAGATTPKTTFYDYDGLGRVRAQRHPDAAERTWEYDGPGALVKEVDEAGLETTYQRDALGLDTTVTGPLGFLVTTAHDEAGRLVRREEGNLAPRPPSVWTYSYEGEGWVTETAPAPVLEAARKTRRRFDGRGQVVEVQQHAGGTQRVTKTAYDGTRPTKVEVTDGTWTQTVTRTWDGRGRPVQARDEWAKGLASYSYEAVTTWAGRSCTVTHTWSHGTAPTEAWEYDGLGQATKHTVGQVMDEWVHDGLGRKETETSADAPTRHFRYGPDGRLVEEAFGSPAEVTRYTYNGRGLPASVETPDGRTTTRGYEFETALAPTSPPGTAKRSLPTRETVSRGAESTTTETDWDDLGRAEKVRTGAGTSDVRETQRAFGPRGELRSVTLPGGATWQYEYDDLNRLTAVAPPAGSSTPVQTWAYEDGLGRVTRHEVGPTTTWTTTYADGVATTQTPNGETVETLLDGRGRVAAVQYLPSASNGPGVTGKQLRYDGFDALVQVTETRSAGSPVLQAFQYDTSHRLTSVVRGLARVDYGYVTGTRQVQTKQLGPGPVPPTVTSTYDGYGRLASQTAPWGTTLVAWEPGGQRLTRLGAEAFGYDGRGWLSTVTTPTRVTTYSVDGRGNRTREVVTGASALAGERRFAYDEADRLVAAQEWDGHVEAWRLRADGTRDEAKTWAAGTPWPVAFSTANPTKHQRYEYRTGDGVLEAVRDVVSTVVDVGLTHDSQGQVTSRTEGGVTTTYGWDADGRLVSASRPQVGGAPGVSAAYEYDALGMRRRATVTVTPATGPPGAAQTRTWTWGGVDGEEEAGEDSSVTGAVAGFRVGDGVNAFTHDALGSVLSQTNASGTNEAQYDAWGTRTPLASNFGPLASSAGFTGHRAESALELIYAKQRWQDPRTGTWLSSDPVGAASYLQSPNELNAYGYAAANPTRFTDPSGREVDCQMLARGNPQFDVGLCMRGRLKNQPNIRQPATPAFDVKGPSAVPVAAGVKLATEFENAGDAIAANPGGALLGTYKMTPMYQMSPWGARDLVKGTQESFVRAGTNLGGFGACWEGDWWTCGETAPFGVVEGAFIIEGGRGAAGGLAKSPALRNSWLSNSVSDPLGFGRLFEQSLGGVAGLSDAELLFMKKPPTAKIGIPDDAFLQLSTTKQVDAAFEEIAQAFGEDYAKQIRTVFEETNQTFISSSDDLGIFYAKPQGTRSTIVLNNSLGNAKILANTILHEVRHFRHFKKFLSGGGTYQEWKALDSAVQERFATSTNIWQGRWLGLGADDLELFRTYYEFYRGPAP